MSKLIKARCKDPHSHAQPDREDIEADVVNPGGWFGKTWLLYVSAGYGGSFYIVEADNLGDAIDELAESERWGHEIAIQGPELSDYGSNCDECSFGVTIDDKITSYMNANGITDRKKVWLDLRGECTTEKLMEPQISGQGVTYDADHLSYYGDEIHGRGDAMPYECTYHHPDLPEEGVSPLEFQHGEYDIEYDNEQPIVTGV